MSSNVIVNILGDKPLVNLAKSFLLTNFLRYSI